MHNLTLHSEAGAIATERELTAISLQQTRNQLNVRTLLAERMINELTKGRGHQQDLARLKICALTRPDSAPQAAPAIVVWDAEQETGLLAVPHLPAIAADQDYQLWVYDPAYPTPVNGGVIAMQEEGGATLAFKPVQPVKQVVRFAITVENKGGATRGEGPVVLSGP